MGDARGDGATRTADRPRPALAHGPRHAGCARHDHAAAARKLTIDVWPLLPEVIDTERLTLRPWRLTDVDDVLAYAQDDEWSRFLRFLPSPYERRHAEEFLARQVLRDRGQDSAWAVTLDGKAIGGINLRLRAEHRYAEMGYSVGRAHWNQGLGTEAAGAVLDLGFTTWPELNRIQAFADVENTASQRVMQKIGMTLEGVTRQSRVERGVAIDQAWWAVLRPEWEARHRA